VKYVLGLTISLLLVSCAPKPSGDFCELAFPLFTDTDLARIIVSEDRSFAEEINLHNQMVSDCH
jgi:hypothetical protein